MYLLGVTENHNCTAALFHDGECIACVSEERFSRTKNDMGVPVRAIEWCLSLLPDGAELEAVAVATKQFDPVQYMMRRGSADWGMESWIKEQKHYWYPKLYSGIDVNYLNLFRDKIRKTKTTPHEFREGMTPAEFTEERRRVIAEVCGVSLEKVLFYDHHSCHAAYANWAINVGEKERLVITADSYGDGLNATISAASHLGVYKVWQTNICDLGRIYKFMTLLLGMKPVEHEYKVMGLAPYAKHRERAYKVFDDTLQVNGVEFEYKHKPRDLFWHFLRELVGERFDDIAGALQYFIENRLYTWITNVTKHHNCPVVCYSGGLSMNVKANREIASCVNVRELIVPPSGGDESLAIGACYRYLFERFPHLELKPIRSWYLGPEYSEKEVEREYEDSWDRLFTCRETNPDEIALLLSGGDIVARMSGRAEFGARALGNRSILAHPGMLENVKELNDRIKCRDSWMPFCPTIKRDRAKDYIRPNMSTCTDKYMTCAFDSKPGVDKILPAVVHPADGTMRPQVLDKEDNPGYYEILKSFENITGIGCVLNTSFNLHGEPIVNSPEDAFNVFRKSGLEYLVIDNMLFTKKEMP